MVAVDGASSSSAAERGPRRWGSRLGVLGGLVCAAGVGTSASWRRGGGVAGGGAALSSFKSYELSYEDFVKEDDVKAFIKMQGLSTDDSFEDLSEYAPRKIEIELDKSSVEGAVGSAALGGFVMTGLTFTDSKVGFTASYVAILTLEGGVERVTSLYGKMLKDKGAADLKDDVIYQALGLKLYNTTHALVALGESTGKLDGPRMLWAWRSDEWQTLCDGKTNDAHDIQWAYDTAAVWQADGTTRIEATDVVTGKNLVKFDEKRVSDPNHVQAVAQDEIFYVSSRQTAGGSTAAKRGWLLIFRWPSPRRRTLRGRRAASSVARWSTSWASPWSRRRR